MSFHRLRVYQAAEQLDALVLPLIENLPLRYASDVDHIIRGLGSIRFNIGEAHGSETPGRKAYHLSVARGSMDEVRAGLRRLAARGALPFSAINKPSTLASAIAKMLTSWINTLKRDAAD